MMSQQPRFGATARNPHIRRMLRGIEVPEALKSDTESPEDRRQRLNDMDIDRIRTANAVIKHARSSHEAVEAADEREIAEQRLLYRNYNSENEQPGIARRTAAAVIGFFGSQGK